MRKRARQTTQACSKLGLKLWPSRDKPEFLAKSLEMSGKNVTGRSIYKIDGYIKPDKTNDKFPLLTCKDGHLVEMSRIAELPTNQIVSLSGMFAHDEEYALWRGLNAHAFIAQYTPFTVFLTIDDTESTVRFTTEQCQGLLRSFSSPSS